MLVTHSNIALPVSNPLHYRHLGALEMSKVMQMGPTFYDAAGNLLMIVHYAVSINRQDLV